METPIDETENLPVNEGLPLRKSINASGAALVVALCLGIGSLSTIGKSAIEYRVAVVTVQLFCFLLIGLLHARLNFKQVTSLPVYTIRALRPTALLAFGIAVALAGFFALFNPTFLFMSVSGGAAFLLPAVIAFSYWSFEQLVEPQFSPWYMRKNLLDNKAFVFLASVTIRIKLAPHQDDKAGKTFKSTVPVQMEFGKIFHYFVAQQQHKGVQIETEDDTGVPLGWQFYVSKSGGHFQIPINPEENMWANQIRPNSLVVAKRISSTQYTPEELPPTNPVYELNQR